jgi:mannosyltransferase
MNTRNIYRACVILVGCSFILIGLLIPSAVLIASLRAMPDGIKPQLLLGGTLFKVGLVLVGAWAVALGYLSGKWRVASKESNHPIRESKLVWISLILILVAAFALRLYHLNAGLWFDEIMTNVHYARLPFGEIITTYDSENNHFLFSLLAHLSLLIFGDSAWALRLPAVLFGVGSIWALYLLGREVSSPREGLLSAALLAFSYHHLWFSQNARGYTGLLFWTILSSYYLMRASKDNLPRTWLYFAFSAALGIYTHLTMIFIVIGQFSVYVTILIARRREPWTARWNGFIYGFGFSAFLTLLLYALVLPQMFGTIGGSETSVVTAWKNPIWTALEIIRGLEIGFSGWALALIAMILFAAGFFSYARTNFAILQLLVIPPAIGAGVVIAVGHHLWPRFFFFAMGFGVLLLIRGVMVVGEQGAKLIRIPMKQPEWIGVALCIGMILVSAGSMLFAYGPKQDYQGAMTYVESEAKPGDAIVTAGLASMVYTDFYKTGWVNVDSTQVLDQIDSRSKRIWLLYTFPPVLQSIYPDVMKSIQENFEVVKEFRGTVGDGTIFVCLMDNSTSTTASR